MFDGDEAAMERFLSAVCTPAWNLELDREREFAEAIATLQGEHPTQASNIAAYRERWIEMIGGTIPGAVEIVEELHASGIPLYALSNIARESFDKLSARHPFMAHFRGALVSGDVKLLKPDQAIFRLLAEKFQLVPERTLFVDDVPANVAGAEEVGFRGHAFSHASALREELVLAGVLKA